jgi:glycosyltransferase involved in cell wall biosynthesis
MMEGQPMETAAEVLTFGNPDLPEGNPDRPLVTFALFAFNQEKYILEAVEGAFSQTYSPLEIILSDDCSHDHTYQIMKEIAQGYKGKHLVKLRRNPKNLGIGGHIMAVINISSASVIVLAAGDDVSQSDRVERVSNEFLLNPDVFAIFSDVRLIDEQSKVIDIHESRWDKAKSIDFLHLIRNGGGIGTGASYAYRKECFYWPWEFPEFIISEDRLLPLRAMCLGSVKHLDIPLVKYRIGNASLSSELVSSRKLAMENNLHIEEIRKTLRTAFSKKMISNRLYNQSLKFLDELPAYAQFIQSIKGKRSLSLKDRLLDNWFNRHTFFERLKNKGLGIKSMANQSDHSTISQ